MAFRCTDIRRSILGINFDNLNVKLNLKGGAAVEMA